MTLKMLNDKSTDLLMMVSKFLRVKDFGISELSRLERSLFPASKRRETNTSTKQLEIYCLNLLELFTLGSLFQTLSRTTSIEFDRCRRLH